MQVEAIGESDVFWDLGSGVGQVALHVAAARPPSPPPSLPLQWQLATGGGRPPKKPMRAAVEGRGGAGESGTERRAGGHAPASSPRNRARPGPLPLAHGQAANCQACGVELMPNPAAYADTLNTTFVAKLKVTPFAPVRRPAFRRRVERSLAILEGRASNPL